MSEPQDLPPVRVSLHTGPPPPDGSPWPEVASTVTSTSVWSARTGGELVNIEGVVIWDASDPEAGPVFYYDAATGETALTAGPNDTVIHFDRRAS